MKGQTNILQLNQYLFVAIIMVVSSSYMVTALILDWKWEDWNLPERDTDRSLIWWIYNILCIISTTFLAQVNLSFLWAGYWDANRRITIMRWLSNSLETDFIKKDELTVRFPTINFMDKKSLLSWLEARRIVVEAGQRFQLRIQVIITCYIVM